MAIQESTPLLHAQVDGPRPKLLICISLLKVTSSEIYVLQSLNIEVLQLVEYLLTKRVKI